MRRTVKNERSEEWGGIGRKNGGWNEKERRKEPYPGGQEIRSGHRGHAPWVAFLEEQTTDWNYRFKFQYKYRNGNVGHKIAVPAKHNPIVLPFSMIIETES